MQNAYGSYPHTPRTPATPNTPGSTGNMGSYPPPPPQNPGRGSYPMMSNTYQPPAPSYATSSAMLPQTTTAASHPQPIAPAPAGGNRGAPVLRPMPAGGVMPQQGMNSPYGQSPLMPQPSMLPEGDQPTHVVGSQGRRGILPSAPGRPAPPAAGTATAKNQIPQKDADGKFPCPHCTKTYLHAKHLKRHLLRHTGDRPYMCVLCRDTFSRSDILKRHFQKCSIRRGNPTGASHLSHPQAHVKKTAAAQKAALGTEGDVSHMNGMGNMPAADGMVPFGLIPASDGMNNIANDQSQLSRSSSMNRLDDANRDRRNMPGSVMGQPARGTTFEQPYNGDVPNNMSANINPQLANYNMPSAQNGMPMFGGANSTQQSNLDWSQMFQPGAQNTYVNTFPPNVGQTQTAIKQEPDPAAARAGAVPGRSTADIPVPFPDWGVPTSEPDLYQQLSNRILNFFFPSGAVTQSTPFVDVFFQPDNIRDFLEKYTHFHVHFSILHIPTFRVMDAYIGLVASMCCIGACYSDRVPSSNVRDVMDLLKTALEGSSRMYASLSDDAQSGTKYEYSSFGHKRQDVEELQAIVLFHVLFIWHGTPVQREKARRAFPLLAVLARNAGLLRVSNSSTLYSHLHQPDSTVQNFNVSNFDWQSWVEQEKRIRTMYTIFLLDSALGLYFNTGPEFDAFELQLPLPADDAAWEARTAIDCAKALGLYGPQMAKEVNPDGTQRCKQPELHLVLKALLHSSYQIQPGTTNLYGKFIIIHALLAMLRKVQLDGSAAIMNRADTPLPQHDWIIGTQAVKSGSTSGRATPVEAMGQQLLDGPTVKAFTTALDKFKSNWDIDMASQFPPGAPVHPRRYGFSKDAIHFYWLATYLLKNARMSDLQMAPDQRFTHVIHLLKSVRDWVVTDGASRGEELGSVGDIDRDFGVRDLTLDMAQLFKPLQKVVDSQGITPVQADAGEVKSSIM
ncbi:hypothetical protein VTK73DRAFT_8333 [Phialemonium thermophilum]|uniref:C2H2-type domain-containing protein n=1 Tax=Phialemonium thermophilum TaxID=223376 RepID=A0ABR3Y7M7_9PEZI